MSDNQQNKKPTQNQSQTNSQPQPNNQLNNQKSINRDSLKVDEQKFKAALERASEGNKSH